MTAPRTREELLLAKLLALLHDPPTKPISITLLGSRLNEYYSEPDTESYCLRYHILEDPCWNKAKTHEKVAVNIARNYQWLLELIERIKIAHPKNSLGSYVHNLDVLASSIERYHISILEHTRIQRNQGNNRRRYGRYQSRRTRESSTYLNSSFIHGLLNIFYPSSLLRGRKHNYKGILYKLSSDEDLIEEINNINNFINAVNNLIRNLKTPKTNAREPEIALHVFSTIYEPLWHERTKGFFWGPADTRAPLADLFDHLYASAMAGNLLRDTLKEGDKLVFAGFLVYFGFPRIKEWLRASRKLSDLSVSSWLATALLWSTVEELVWRLGPDILLSPSFRWNHWYAWTLMRKRLGIDPSQHRDNSPEGVLRHVVEDLYGLEGDPIYGWEPAFTTLLLPMLEEPDLAGDATGEVKDVLEGLEDALKIEGSRAQIVNDIDLNNRNTIIRILEKARLLAENLYNLYRAKWNALLDGLATGQGNNRPNEEPYINNNTNLLLQATGYDDLTRRVANLVRDIPPLEPLIVVVPIILVKMNIRNGGRRLIRYSFMIGLYSNIKDRYSFTMLQCTARKNISWYCERNGGSVVDIREDGLGVSGFVERVLNDAELAGDDGVKTFYKIVYGLGFYVLWREVSRLRGEVLPVSWVRAARRARLGGFWRTCSVCKHAPAVVEFPGRDTPEGPDKKYVEAVASHLKTDTDREEENRKIALRWRPVFRPGEALCPHCYVKRILGTPEKFKEGFKALMGWEPSREPVFPSTDDMAGLGVKLALAELALHVLHNRDLAEKILERLGLRGDWPGWVREVAKLSRSEKVSDLFDGDRDVTGGLERKIKVLIRERRWVPWILDAKLRRVLEELEGSEALHPNDSRVKALVVLLVLLSFELQDLDRLLRNVTGELRGLDALLAKLREAVRGTLRDGKVGAILRGLRSPPRYYSIVWFDVDRTEEVFNGLFPQYEEDGGEYMDYPRYWCMMVEGLCKDYEDIRDLLCTYCFHDYQESVWRSLTFIRQNSSLVTSGGASPDPLVRFASLAGSTLVTPALHVSVARALSYTLHQARLAAERLGGVPVYLAGCFPGCCAVGAAGAG